MLENFIYENHLGQRFIGLDNGVYLNYNDLRDYSWQYDTINNRISNFYRKITSRSLPLVFCGETDEQAISARNNLLDIAEADIMAKLSGKIYVGEYYTYGYITGSVKSNYLIANRLCNINLTFTSDDPTWYKDTKYRAFLASESVGSTAVNNGIDYPFDYEHDYTLFVSGSAIKIDSAWGAAFRICIFGPASNPSILINGHSYTVNGEVGANERLIIDSSSKTITFVTETGKKTNWFSHRSRTSNIFQELSDGDNAVEWDGSFGFDLTVIEKRSEPKWT